MSKASISKNKNYKNNKLWIEKAFITFKSLFQLDMRVYDHFDDMPYNVIDNLGFYLRDSNFKERIEKYFDDYVTSSDIPYITFKSDLQDECSDLSWKFKNDENDKIKDMFIDTTLMKAICATINPKDYHQDIYNRQMFIREFINQVRRNYDVFSDYSRRDVYRYLDQIRSILELYKNLAI